MTIRPARACLREIHQASATGPDRDSKRKSRATEFRRTFEKHERQKREVVIFLFERWSVFLDKMRKEVDPRVPLRIHDKRTVRIPDSGQQLRVSNDSRIVLMQDLAP
jgi:hypothetical protein